MLNKFIETEVSDVEKNNNIERKKSVQNNKTEKNQIHEHNVSKEEKSNENQKLSKNCEIGPLTPRQYSEKAYKIRTDAASFQKDIPIPGHSCNGDAGLYPNKIANYSKALPHNALGEVNMGAYNIWLKALTTGNPEMFEEIPLGGVRKFANPQGAYAFDLEGPNAHHLTMPVPPNFSSAWMGSEMAENYWRALTRDIPFAEYDKDLLIHEAAHDMSKFSEYYGPKDGGAVTPGTLFRGNTVGDLVGPYISQFLCKDVPFGSKILEQQYRTTLHGKDYMTSYDEWLSIQNGGAPGSSGIFDPKPRYIRNGRDLGEWVHGDFTYQSVLNACLILLSFGDKALCLENPYLCSKTQVGFITFGAAYILDLIGKSARIALEAAWFQKFLVHRRLRPEEFGGRVHNNLTGATSYPINSELLNCKAVSKVFNKYGTYLLPMAYPEGGPTHTSYPAGHACIAGAGVTMMKAFFNEDFIIPNPVVASADGLSVLPYSGVPLTIGGELNKLGSNLSLGRDTAGVHWRSDGVEGLKIGEAVAIGILHDFKKTYNEDFKGFCFTKFDGTTVII
ncbi:vanadium-dependent haloperoxidase [Clostridium sp. ZS2-4]|uniref:vanadium-dependent haloperoxidase n=1 Tax=Clostridium sp. ZS2-4 TaxID=2987703 RepID=UPI00227BD3A4|nr:vanadium-dependent haloperoxidase [Clostridium sp. ZS2-4]MCY6354528.1 vanadium-dependent haloperoxidase [Clostridium sp. ZS2-4]